MRVYAPVAFRYPVNTGTDYPYGWQELPQSLADTLLALKPSPVSTVQTDSGPYKVVEYVTSTAAAIPALPYQGDGVFVKDENGATWPWNGASYGKPLTSNPATGVADSAAQAAIFAARSLTTNVFVQVNSFCTAQVGGTGSYSYDTQTDAGVITVGVGSGIAPDTVPIYMGGATKVRFIFPNTATVKVN